ncbi:sporulation protein YpjB [Halalkalibacterium halodurans]|uniref:sporulation protein YpjB n=1 Tax=Halalkalibacterium halodurans TaxID=86665 RepID=UPI002AA9877C|nr:sporulation protein YpjB [Halalkalibacterium halodurans]MDY7222247.1 sporulation protein YpjB [Halalkalibacterium halodurans]MDY7241468.1 sporulation protein YpjB [Halalkalibacterium halodurans]
MRVVIAGLCFLVLFLSPVHLMYGESDSQDTWKELNRTSDQVLQLVKQEKLEEAKQLLDYFQTQFVKADYDDRKLSMTSLRTVTTSYERANQAVTATNMGLDERIRHVTEFRLVVDAIVSEHHPLWLHSETSIMHALTRMKEAIQTEDHQGFQHRLNEFLNHYQMIRPSLTITLEPAHLQQVESQVSYMENFRMERSADEVENHLNLMEETFTALFAQVKEDSADPSLLWVMFTIGGMIIASLSYAGWRKYKGEKRKVKVKE